MATLDGALPFADRPHRAVLVRHDLHFDVPAPGQVALTEDGGVAEGGVSFALGGCYLLGQIGKVVDHPHPAAAAAGRGFHQHRQLIRGHRVGM